MYTFCPHCSAVFKVSAAHLGKAGGLARCGECREIYSAIDYLYEDLTTARMALAELEANARAEETAAAGLPESEIGTRADADPDAAEVIEPLTRPIFTGSREQPSPPVRHMVSGAGIGLMLLLLALQWVYFNRADLAGNASWRPALEQACELLRCELPLRIDPARMQMIQRDVRKHPEVEGALLINVSFENRADFTQSYPVLEVSFSDHSGVPVAMRHFHPSEYLAAGTDLAAGMAANVSLDVVLEVQDPGESAASYQFGFL
jgi:predicted Zn finger-like uncharacterized protein